MTIMHLPSITEIVQNVSKHVTITIYEHGLLWIIVPSVGHQLSKYCLRLCIDECTRNLKVLSADVEFNSSSVRHFKELCFDIASLLPPISNFYGIAME